MVMDIAILAAARFPIGEPFAGGMEMHTHVLADVLHHRGHDVTVYAADGVGPYRVRRMLALDFAGISLGSARRVGRTGCVTGGAPRRNACRGRRRR